MLSSPTMTGRIVLYTNMTGDFTSRQQVADELSNAIPTHFANQADIIYLMNYFKGVHSIVNREKTVREDIDYKVTLNYAQAATRDIVGYYLGKPIDYVARTPKKRKQVDVLKEYTNYENSNTVDFQVAENQSICGVGYKGIFPDKFQDEVPFNIASLDPRTTFVVYSTALGNPPIFCVSFYTTAVDANTGDCFDVYTVWDRSNSYIIKVPSGTSVVSESEVSEPKKHLSKALPIVEVPNNQWRIGDWETSIALMDSIDALASDSVNDVAQFVQSFLAFIGAELPEPTVDTDGNVIFDPVEEMKRNKIISLVPPATNPNANMDIKYIANTLDASNVSQLREYLETSLRIILGIPDRKTRGGGGGDTGDAVFMRDGWQDIDLVASNKEMFAIKAEKQVLTVMINLLTADPEYAISDLTVRDIDIKFSRTKTSNIQVKAQAYSTIVATKTITPEDALSLVDLTTDEGEVVKRGYAYWDKEATIGLERVQEQMKTKEGSVDSTLDEGNSLTRKESKDNGK